MCCHSGRCGTMNQRAHSFPDHSTRARGLGLGLAFLRLSLVRHLLSFRRYQACLWPSSVVTGKACFAGGVGARPREGGAEARPGDSGLGLTLSFLDLRNKGFELVNFLRLVSSLPCESGIVSFRPHLPPTYERRHFANPHGARTMRKQTLFVKY